ncbi:hypothetical protein GCM10007887_07320 [Methylobacterium haplocladii]|uniref:Uncharacterized protein n=1 Tax=Methylobacterium haplocladii TaxID=1176176 RepID=A0A512IMK4_9HYPH|nr:hypothetical protein MHA02_13220 [Methylobacterium haplocladii]GLS58076.1 hypothetical protein GCM10007887_07320 [Methylobacterium haplocladii]
MPQIQLQTLPTDREVVDQFDNNLSSLPTIAQAARPVLDAATRAADERKVATRAVMKPQNKIQMGLAGKA